MRNISYVLGAEGEGAEDGTFMSYEYCILVWRSRNQCLIKSILPDESTRTSWEAFVKDV